jgi:hypothetical protein
VKGKKDDIMQLAGLFQNSMIIGGKRFFRRTYLTTLGAKDVTVKLVELPKIPMVVRGKIFKRNEGVMCVKERR